VSTPVSWEEVEEADELRFEQDEVLERVARDGDLFAPVLTLTQELPRFG
jgi:bifunctional non-homologous end joining protein LigD